MLLGVYGMFASGKTYALSNNMDRLAAACHPAHKLTIVLADIKMLYNYKRKAGAWQQLIGERDTWKGEQEGKRAIIKRMISERDRVWVVESARFFGGIHYMLLTAYQEAGGGLAFIVPTVTECVGRQFLIERAAKAHKDFRADYWTAKRLEYECRGRYMNLMQKRYIPAGVPVWEFSIDYKRSAWNEVLQRMDAVLAWDTETWYNPFKLKLLEPISDGRNCEDYHLGALSDAEWVMLKQGHHETKNSADKRQQRKWQDDNSASVDRQVQRHPLIQRKIKPF